MSRTPIDQLIPRADKHIIRAFPRVAQRLENSVDEMDRSELDTFLKVLPGAIERFQTITGPTKDLHESVEVAISQLVASFSKPSFGSQTVAEVEPVCQNAHSNTPIDAGETAEGVSESELPNGSDTDQSVGSTALPHNELETPAGNTGESSDLQTDGPNPRVQRRKQLRGKALYRRRLQELGEAGNNRG